MRPPAARCCRDIPGCCACLRHDVRRHVAGKLWAVSRAEGEQVVAVERRIHRGADGIGVLVGIGQHHPQRPILETPVGDGVPIALGLIHRADERFARVLQQSQSRRVSFQASLAVGRQPLHGIGQSRLAVQGHIHRALEDVDSAAAPRHFDAELRALVHHRCLGSMESEPVGGLIRDLGGQFAHAQPALSADWISSDAGPCRMTRTPRSKFSSATPDTKCSDWPLFQAVARCNS